MILNLELSNWRSHEKSFFEFSKGTNMLVGFMGSGKSTVLDGISFALFGTFPALERRKISIEDILRLNENNASVSLELIWMSKRYRIKRTIEKGKTTTKTDAEISCDGKLLERGTTAVNSYVEQLLSINYDLFSRAIYSEQNNIDYFMTLDPRRRKQEMDVLLGLDRFETARANSISLLNRIKSQRLRLEQKFNLGNLKDLELKVIENQEKLRTLTQEREGIEKSLEENKIKNLELLNFFKELKKKSEFYESLNKELLLLQGRLEVLKKDIPEKFVVVDYNIEELNNELNKATASTKSKNQGLQDIAVKIGGFESLLKNAKKESEYAEKLNAELKMAGGTEKLAEFRKLLDEKLKLLTEKRIELNMNSAQIEENEEILKNAKPDVSVCPFCENKLDQDHMRKLIDEKTKKIIQCHESVDRLNIEIENTESHHKEIQKKIHEIELLVQKVSAIKPSNTQEIESELVNLIAGKKKFGLEMKSEEEQLEQLRKNADGVRRKIEDQQKTIKRIKETQEAEVRMNELRTKITEIKFDKNEYEKIGKEMEEARILYENNKGQLERLTMQIKNTEQVCQLLGMNLKEMRDIEGELGYLVNVEEELAIYKNSLLITQTNLRMSLIESINVAMNEIWRICYPYNDYKEIRMQVTEKDYSFEIFNGDWVVLDTIASGGERACAALTLRVALAMVLTPNLSWLILDEPTHNLDKTAIELLSTTLQQKIPEVVEQTFVITHEEGLMGSEFASSYRLNRDKENLGSTKIERI
ncbi:SMC family ATPase [Candidatus Micrarchaeota archaeon]|nr:SMC family ATPase [Candidatus Micrarchaeota archaeon]